MSYYTALFRTRAFAKEPVATLLRASNWILGHRLLNRHARIVVPAGRKSFVLDLPPLPRQSGSAGIFLQRQYYEPLLEHLDLLVRPGYVVFDCGANQGIYTCAFGTLVGPKGRVEAFEPQKYAVEIARRNVVLNSFDNVRINRFAISSMVGNTFLDTSRGGVAASIVKDFGRSRGETVAVTTLDTFAEEHSISHVDLIKMDLEGAEFEALLGAQRIIEACRPALILEGADGDASWLKSQEFLAKRDYETYTFGRSGALVRLERLGGHCPNVVFFARNSFRKPLARRP